MSYLVTPGPLNRPLKDQEGKAVLIVGQWGEDKEPRTTFSIALKSYGFMGLNPDPISLEGGLVLGLILDLKAAANDVNSALVSEFPGGALQ